MDRYLISLPLTPIVIVVLSYLAYRVKIRGFRKNFVKVLAAISVSINTVFVFMDAGNGIVDLIHRNGQKPGESIYWAIIAAAAGLLFFAAFIGVFSYCLSSFTMNYVQYRIKRLENEKFWQFIERRSEILKKMKTDGFIIGERSEVYDATEEPV